MPFTTHWSLGLGHWSFAGSSPMFRNVNIAFARNSRQIAWRPLSPARPVITVDGSRNNFVGIEAGTQRFASGITTMTGMKKWLLAIALVCGALPAAAQA